MKPSRSGPSPTRVAVLSATLATFSLSYFGWLTYTALEQLNDDYVVTGLFRVYQPPRMLGDVEVFDTRPGPLVAELRNRFRPDAPLPKSSDPVEAARQLGLEPRPATGPGDGRRPRLVRHQNRQLLVLGAYAAQLVVFDPKLGVALMPELPAHAPATELMSANEAPW